jgi:hypothetical protein
MLWEETGRSRKQVYLSVTELLLPHCRTGAEVVWRQLGIQSMPGVWQFCSRAPGVASNHQDRCASAMLLKLNVFIATTTQLGSLTVCRVLFQMRSQVVPRGPVAERRRAVAI